MLDIKGLKTVVMRHGTEDVDAMLQAIKEEIETRSIDAHNDNMTLVLLRRTH